MREVKHLIKLRCGRKRKKDAATKGKKARREEH